ncbi:ArsC family reductase [Cytophagaceae bacterium ABcell3]|nr:ArsC family reductase [Cytophagaceae bacterium ABcell3]
MKVYGIKNCDTVKKALKWLNDHEVEFEFHDYKKEGVDEQKLQEWFAQFSAEDLVNKRGTTWRKLTDEEKEAASDPSKAAALIQDNTSMIKRPLIENDGAVVALGLQEMKDFVKVYFGLEVKN